MTWHVPRTWVAGEVVTEVHLNEDVRDNMNSLSVHLHTGAAGDGGSAVTPSSLAVAGGPFAINGAITPAQITAQQNDYNPTGLASATVLRLSSDAARAITGLAGGADGRWMVIANVGLFAITLVDESSSSTAANRFALQGDQILGPDGTAWLVYDDVTGRWRAHAVIARVSNEFVAMVKWGID